MLFDCHTHSVNSDGVNSVEEMCVSAIEKGIDGIMITDHADMKFYNECNIMIFEDKIKEILKKIIDRNIALELNTARMCNADRIYAFRLKEILDIYKNLGGKLITLGSDAHSKPYVANNFDLATGLLKECGFNSIYYYEKREAKEVLI